MREFKRYFGLRVKAVCHVRDLSHMSDGLCVWDDCFGASRLLGRGSKVNAVEITLDPRCWDQTAWVKRKLPEGPYGVALHEFIHMLLGVKASRRYDFDTEEVAVRMLTDLFINPIANREPIRNVMRDHAKAY